MTPALLTESLYLDLSERTKLRLTGADRVRFLNGQVSNDVRRSTADTSVYTGVMTIKGKLCADAFVHVTGDSLLIDAEPELREALLARMDRYIIADDVQIEDVSEAFGLLHLLDYAADAGEGHMDDLPAALGALGPNVQTVRSSRVGRLGLDLFYAAALEAEVRARVHAAGFTLLNEDGLESLRILAGVPRWGAELDENTLPAEAGIEERAVSYTKGCYIGQEVVSRIKSVGHVNRQLRGLRALDASPLFPGMILLPAGGDGAPVADARPLGTITSAASTSGHGGGAYLALGYVRRPADAAGTRLLAVLPPDPADAAPVASPPCAVEVCSLPFI